MTEKQESVAAVRPAAEPLVKSEKPKKRSMSCELTAEEFAVLEALRDKLSQSTGFQVSQRQLWRRVVGEGTTVLKQKLGVQ